MDTQVLKAFIAVAECGTVTGAARGLGYSQPGLSQRLQCLERSIGCILFSRSSGRMQLTAQGLALLPYARMIVVLSDEMRREVPDPRSPTPTAGRPADAVLVTHSKSL